MGDIETSQAIGLHWSKVTATTDPSGRVLKTRWWQHPPILRHINEKVCGKPVDGFSAGLTLRVRSMLGPRLPLSRGISVGCGNGMKEMTLLREGIVQVFDLYELADSRIAAGRESSKTTARPECELHSRRRIPARERAGTIRSGPLEQFAPSHAGRRSCGGMELESIKTRRAVLHG
jgi:hypothetical protein